MGTTTDKWYKRSYRRHLIDIHIPDWDDMFLSRIDVERYVGLLKRSQVDTTLIYTISCLGICNWPTPYGHMHNGLKGRDLFGELVAECRKQGIGVIAYHNFWSKWAYEEHPEWRFVSSDGKGTAEYLWTPGRYGVCCFNTPYGEFQLKQVADIAQRYDFDGFWMDMLHWPYSVCYCSSCRKRYREEAGADIPRRVDWRDPAWVRFQRTRERWLAEYTTKVTDTVKRIKPASSVGHQCAAWAVGWHGGQTNDFFAQCEYASGDFYGDSLHQTFVSKLLYHLTENKPFEFMTSRSPDLTHHTTLKSEELLMAQAYSAIANRGGFLMIDAIDPVGTMDESVYERMGNVFAEIRRYEDHIVYDSLPCQDVAIYINFESEINLAENGKPVLETDEFAKPMLKGAMNAAKSLLEANIPFGVITKRNLRELGQFQVVVLPDVVMLDAEEIAALTAFVRSGGSLYASYQTGLLDKSGHAPDAAALAGLLGVAYEEATDETVTYMTPAGAGSGMFLRYSEQSPLTILGPQMKAAALPGADVLATVTLPYVNPKEINRYAAAISNPPGIPTAYPALTVYPNGAGKSMYAAGRLESMETTEHRIIFANLIRSLRQRPFHFESDAPKAVELTLFHEPERSRYMINLLNFQSELPNIPVEGIRVSVTLDEGRKPARLLLLPEGAEWAFETDGATVSFTAPRLASFAMMAIEYDE